MRFQFRSQFMKAAKPKKVHYDKKIDKKKKRMPFIGMAYIWRLD